MTKAYDFKENFVILKVFYGSSRDQSCQLQGHVCQFQSQIFNSSKQVFTVLQLTLKRFEITFFNSYLCHRCSINRRKLHPFYDAKNIPLPTCTPDQKNPQLDKVCQGWILSQLIRILRKTLKMLSLKP